MQLIVCWIVFPLLLAVLAYGCGSLVGAIAGVRLGSLAIPVGLAVIIVLLDLAVRTGPLRPLAVELVVVVAVVGLVLAWPLRRPPLGPTLAALGVFAVFAAPIVLSGHATFAGYIKLDDTATFFALTDRVFSHPLTAAGLPISTYERTLFFYLGSGYPLGSFLPLGLGHRLVNQDIAWLFAPYLAFLAASLALALEAIAASLVRVVWQRAVIAFIAAQAALLYGYTLWGGVKEVVAAVLVATFVAACPQRDRLLSLRPWIPAVIVAAAIRASESSAGLGWILLPAAAYGLLALRAFGLRRFVRSGAMVPAVLIAVAVTVSLTSGGFLKHNFGVLGGAHELGNLVGPLNGLQVLGIWPNGDFRYPPDQLTVTHVLVAFVALAGAIGVVTALVRRAWPVAFYMLAAGIGALVIGLVGSPWLGGKALATASPAFILCALVGAAVIGAKPPDGLRFLSGRRPEAAAIAIAIAGGVVWSNVLAYNQANIAPYGQLAELEHIGARIAGQGPTLMTEYQPYGARHFLRAADAESASELRYRVIPLRTNPQGLPKGASADINQFALAGVMVYRTLVLRRSPVASRPPAPFTRTFVGRYYEVWQRPASASPAIVADVALGAGAGAQPDCASVTSLATTAGVRTLVAAPAIDPPPQQVALSRVPGSPWPENGNDPNSVLLDHAAATTLTVSVATAGRYRLWLAGSGPRGSLSAFVDGTRVGGVRDQLQYAGDFVSVGAATLSAGSHTLRLSYGGSDLLPGSGGPPPMVGPLVVAADKSPPALVRVAPRAARTLCGRRLYWVEGLSA